MNLYASVERHLSPLRGWRGYGRRFPPGLTPWATICRPSGPANQPRSSFREAVKSELLNPVVLMPATLKYCQEIFAFLFPVL